MPKPRLDLDPIAAILDHALSMPLAQLVKRHAPELHGAIVDAREHLPDVAAYLAAQVEEQAIGSLRDEARQLERDAVHAIQQFLGRPNKRVRATKRRTP